MENKNTYEEGKYCIQDVGSLYIGAKYCFSELLEDDEIPFKVRLLTERYILPEADPEDTLETHFYYLDRSSFLTKIYRQLKGRVKVNVLEDRKKKGGISREYVTKVLPVEELAAIPAAEKERQGMVIQELILSKFALMAF